MLYVGQDKDHYTQIQPVLQQPLNV